MFNSKFVRIPEGKRLFPEELLELIETKLGEVFLCFFVFVVSLSFP